MKAKKQNKWLVTFTVYADPDYKESDIIEEVEQALDGTKPFSQFLDAVCVTAEQTA